MEAGKSVIEKILTHSKMAPTNAGAILLIPA
jgi:hypothetical protein